MSSKELITHFYTAFKELDYKTMQGLYADDAVFNDPVFGLLTNGRVRLMWEMLCKRAQHFSLEFSAIEELDDVYSTCRWTSSYVFNTTGRPVVNKVQAHVKIEYNKIIEHTDVFDFWIWSRQALGISGMLLGWTNFLQNKVNIQALNSLEQYELKRLTETKD